MSWKSVTQSQPLIRHRSRRIGLVRFNRLTRWCSLGHPQLLDAAGVFRLVMFTPGARVVRPHQVPEVGRAEQDVPTTHRDAVAPCFLREMVIQANGVQSVHGARLIHQLQHLVLEPLARPPAFAAWAGMVSVSAKMVGIAATRTNRRRLVMLRSLGPSAEGANTPVSTHEAA